MSDRSLFPRLKRMFSTDVIVRNIGGRQLKVVDVNSILQYGELQTNTLIDRYTRISIATRYNTFNPGANFQTLRTQIYSDYEAMDTDGIISAVLDMLCEECSLKSDMGEVLGIKSSNENIQRILYNLFYEILNVEFNLPMWVRSMCLHEDTIIPLLDGNEISIKELSNRFENDPENPIWVYSVQEGTNQIVPGKIKWAGLTRQNTQILRVTLDDNTYLDVTPDHKFILRNGDKKQASDLLEGDSLMPFYTRETSKTSDCIEGYIEVKSKEYLTTLSDTYCMEVTGPFDEEDRHNFAVCSKNIDGSYDRNGVFVSNCKYGDFFLRLEIAEKFGVFNVRPMSVYEVIREEGQDPDNPSYIRFRVDPSALSGGSPAKNAITYENYEVAHFRFISDTNYLPYGRSYLEPSRKLFKQLSLLEDAMLIHRIMRAPEKRVFYLNIGNIPPSEVENFVQQQTSALKKTPFIDPQTGEYNLKFNMQNMIEDYIIPVRGGDNVTKIDTTKGLEYSGIEDVEYIRDKMLASLKIPKAFLNYSDELNGKCIHPDTKIPLLDGRILSIKDISLLFENENDPNLWVYSYDKESDSVIPGKVVLARKTRKDAHLVKITLDNGKFVITTPDHGYILKGGEKIEAQKLKEGDSLQAVYKINKKIRNNQNDYEHVYQPSENKWKTTHKMVDEWLNGKLKNNGFDSVGSFKRDDVVVIHHKDFNRFNNNPDNLQRCTFREHSNIHIENAEKGIWTVDAKEKAKKTKNTKEYKEKASEIGKRNMAKWMEIDPNIKNRVRDAWLSKTFEERSEIVKKGFTDSTILKLSENGKNTYAINGEKLHMRYKEVFGGVRKDLHRENSVVWINRPDINSIVSFIQEYPGNLLDINKPKKLAKKMGYSLHVLEDAIKISGWDITEFFNEYTGFILGRSPRVRKEFLVEVLSGYHSVQDFISDYCVGRKKKKTFEKILGSSLNSYINKTYNHKVTKIEFLDYTSDTYNMEVYDKNENHNFLIDAGIVIKNSTIASLDVRFSRTIERIQRIIVSELTKIAIIHLMVQGYTDSDLVNFDLTLHNPSIITQQEKVALLKEKVELAGNMLDQNIVSSDWIYTHLFDMSEDTYNQERDLIAEDVKRKFRWSQIENEGNDPAESGISYGTPHDLASQYKDGRKNKDVPDGYDETKPQDGPGRPKKHISVFGTDKARGGRDPLGKDGMKDLGLDKELKPNYRGGGIALEALKNTQIHTKKYDQSPSSPLFGKKILLFENKNQNKSILDESNIKDVEE